MDWLKYFEDVQICNLSPDSFQGQLTIQKVMNKFIRFQKIQLNVFIEKKGKHITWHQKQFDGA